jgi:pimeloyl-ACP methyl ester carboxylesterase
MTRVTNYDRYRLTRSFRSHAGMVAWDEYGPAEAEPVVLLHGTPFSSYVWRHIARALATRLRVIVWDMPGYGDSQMSEGQDVSLAAQGRAFAELVDHWGLARPQVVAHDIGGAVALRAHLLHGVAYRRLVLVDPVAVAPWGSPFFRLAREHAAVFSQLPTGLHHALVREYVSSASAAPLPAATLEALVGPWMGEHRQPAFYRQIAAADQRHTDEVQPRYGEIDLPVLVCWGTQDRWIPAERGHELAGLIPGARLHLIEGAGHLVQEDAPAELTAALVDFLW